MFSLIRISFFISIILQFVAAFIALRLISFSKRKLSWILISIGFSIMAVRRFIEMMAFLNKEFYRELSLLNSWLGISTSIIITIGVLLIRELFFELRKAELERKRAQQHIYSAIINTEEKERKRFAVDMHDGLGPLLSTIKLYVNELISEEVSLKEKKESVDYINQLIDTAIEDIRTISNNLTPKMIHEYGLNTALKEFCDTIRKTQKIQIDFKFDSQQLEIKKEHEINIFRIVTELIHNTLKHAEARKISISILRIKEGNIELSYTDNGKGFNLDEILNLKDKSGGIQHIYTRVASMDGQIDIVTQPQAGLNVSIVI